MRRTSRRRAGRRQGTYASGSGPYRWCWGRTAEKGRPWSVGNRQRPEPHVGQGDPDRREPVAANYGGPLVDIEGPAHRYLVPLSPQNQSDTGRRRVVRLRHRACRAWVRPERKSSTAWRKARSSSRGKIGHRPRSSKKIESGVPVGRCARLGPREGRHQDGDVIVKFDGKATCGDMGWNSWRRVGRKVARGIR